MRHGCANTKLGRTQSHRRALLMNLANALLEHEKIKTTAVKARVLRPYVEKLITLAKTDNRLTRARAFKELQDKRIVQRLFETVGPRFATRNGGYLRIIRLGHRVGDAADLAQIEFV